MIKEIIIKTAKNSIKFLNSLPMPSWAIFSLAADMGTMTRYSKITPWKDVGGSKSCYTLHSTKLKTLRAGNAILNIFDKLFG